MVAKMWALSCLNESRARFKYLRRTIGKADDDDSPHPISNWERHPHFNLINQEDNNIYVKKKKKLQIEKEANIRDLTHGHLVLPLSLRVSLWFGADSANAASSSSSWSLHVCVAIKSAIRDLQNDDPLDFAALGPVRCYRV